LDIRSEIRGTPALAVDLRYERIQRTHLPTVIQQLVGKVRADEARTAGDQCASRHARPLCSFCSAQLAGLARADCARTTRRVAWPRADRARTSFATARYLQAT